MNKPKRDCYCINLRRAANAVSTVYDAHLARLGITVNQYSILRGTERIAPCSVSELAAHLGLDRTSLVRMLKPLVSQGMILDQAEKGRRSRQLCLSPAGQTLIQEARPLWQKAQEAVEQCIGRTQTEMLMDTLTQLEAAAETLFHTE